MAIDDERARQFEAIINGGPDFIAFASVDGKMQFVNESGRRLVGIEDTTDVCQLLVSDFLTGAGLTDSDENELPGLLSTGSWTGVSTLRDWRGGPPSPSV